MKTRLFLLFVPLFAAALFGQGQFPSGGTGTLHGAGAPTGSCAAGALYTNDTTGALYSCNAGTWAVVSGGGVTPGATIDLPFPVVLFNAACQGAAGKSINGNFPLAATPSGPDLHAGSATLPQFCAAQFPAATPGTQYMEWSTLLPPDFKANTPLSLTAKIHTETATSGAVTADVKFACTGADGSAIQPTYAALQKFGAVAISALEVEYTATLAAPTFTCGAGQTLYTRFELNSDTTATGLIDLTNLQLMLVRAVVVQP